MKKIIMFFSIFATTTVVSVEKIEQPEEASTTEQQMILFQQGLRDAIALAAEAESTASHIVQELQRQFQQAVGIDQTQRDELQRQLQTWTLETQRIRELLAQLRAAAALGLQQQSR